MQFHQTAHISYRSPKSRGTATVVLLSIYLVSCFLSIIADFKELEMYSGRDIIVSTDEDVQAVEVFSGVVALFGLIVFIATAIAFCMWLYRIYQNLYAMGVKNLRMSPGWAVGYYFIPIISLYMPYRGMKDAWNACSPEHIRQQADWKRFKGHSLIKWWWFFWLFRNILVVNTNNFSSRADTLAELKTLTYAYIFTDLVDIVATILAIFLIIRLTKRQETFYSLLSSGQPSAPINGNPTPPQVSPQPYAHPNGGVNTNQPNQSYQPFQSDFKWDD